MNVHDVIVGFSVNPEIVGVYDSSCGSEKLLLEDIRVDLSGSAADAAIAIQTLGGHPLLIGLTGPVDGDGSTLLDWAVRKAGIPFLAIEALNHPSVAFLPVDRALPLRVAGMKGEVLPGKVKSAIAKIKSQEFSYGSWGVATGVRPSEAAFAGALLDMVSGSRVLSPHRSFCAAGEKEIFALLAKADLFILNRYEYAGYAVAQPSLLHEYGPSIVVVTEDEQGGFYSFKGRAGRFAAVSYSSGKVYPTGAGDWFLGALVREFIARGVAVRELDEQTLRECLAYAAKIAGRKVTVPGSGKIPSLQDGI